MQTQVLLSIKPEFAKKIFEGTKKYEFRKIIFKSKNVKRVIVYASAPLQKVIGEFEITTILTQKKAEIWEKTKHFSGIEKKYFDAYFSDKVIAHALKISKVKKYSIPLCLKKDFQIQTPPQSFVYLD